MFRDFLRIHRTTPARWRICKQPGEKDNSGKLKVLKGDMSGKNIPALSIDALTPFFDTLCTLGGYGKRFRLKILAAAKITDGERILDVGCGTATLIVLAKQQYPSSFVMGFDPDVRALTIGKRKVTHAKIPVTVFAASAESVPLASSSIDVIVSSLIFHHLPTEVKKLALGEIHRVLKPSGRFLLADFGQTQGFLMGFLDASVRLLRLPEAETMQDNVEGRLPIFLTNAGFVFQETIPAYRGIRFYLASKEERVNG